MEARIDLNSASIVSQSTAGVVELMVTSAICERGKSPCATIFFTFTIPLLFPSLQNNHGMMNGRIVCGDVIVRISGDQGKKNESLVTHMLSYMYIHVHFRSQIHSVHLCMEGQVEMKIHSVWHTLGLEMDKI